METEMEKYIFFVLCFLGLVIKIFFGQFYSDDGVNGPASSTLWGYGLILICLASYFLIHFINNSKASSNVNNTDGIVSMMINTLYKMKNFMQEFFNYNNFMMGIMFVFAVLLWGFVINFTYYTKINQGHVASDYYFYSTISTFLIAVQLIILFKQIADNKGFISGNNSEINLKYNGIGFLISIINGLFLGITNVILEYFSTDG